MLNTHTNIDAYRFLLCYSIRIQSHDEPRERERKKEKIHMYMWLSGWYKCSNHIQNTEEHISLTVMTKPNRDRSHNTLSIWKYMYCFRCWWRSDSFIFSLYARCYFHTQKPIRDATYDMVGCIIWELSIHIFMSIRLASNNMPMFSSDKLSGRFQLTDWKWSKRLDLVPFNFFIFFWI